ncbi:MAG: 50S ribosomal protein L13 [Bacteroidales bacterium]|nr:50S ribosomal protein L13 [Bacteroidales bacterium]
MDTLSYKTVSANKATVKKEWLVIDAEGEVLGRLASTVAKLLRGKLKPDFTPHVDCGDNVIVLNAHKIKLTGSKWADKTYISHTGYPGGQRSITAEELMVKKPKEMVRKAVKGMLPKNRLSNQIINNLYIYDSAEHNHEAQQPRTIKLNEIK